MTIPESKPGQVIWAPDTYPTPGAMYGPGADPSGRVPVLHGLFARLGHPEVLAASRRHLERAGELNQETAQRHGEARQAWTQAHAAFLDGSSSVEEYLAAEQAAELWFDLREVGGVPAAMAALGRAQRDLRARAAALLPAESPGLYQLAQREATSAVDATAALPELPQRCWSAPDPAAAAMEEGAEQTYLELQRQQARFALCHQAGALLRAVGGLGNGIYLPGGAPESVGFAFRRWDLALVGDAEIRRLRPPLRVRWAVDHGWEPGLWLASDISASPEPAPPPRRFALAGWVGR